MLPLAEGQLVLSAAAHVSLRGMIHTQSFMCLAVLDKSISLHMHAHTHTKKLLYDGSMVHIYR